MLVYKDWEPIAVFSVPAVLLYNVLWPIATLSLASARSKLLLDKASAPNTVFCPVVFPPTSTPVINTRFWKVTSFANSLLCPLDTPPIIASGSIEPNGTDIVPSILIPPFRDKSPVTVNAVSWPTDVIFGCAAVVTVPAVVALVALAADPVVFWFNVGISEATNALKLPAPSVPLGAA